jgi:hypothetical protein
MSGYSRFYVFGGQGGYLGADGVNPIALMILIGDGNRQWLEPLYVDPQLERLGRLSTIVPAVPDHPDNLLDACIAFFPCNFEQCPTFAAVKAALGDAERLDFDAHPEEVPEAWSTLREEARPIFAELNVWQADLAPINGT